DPGFRVSNSSNATLISNDDYDYPANQDALLESITIPRTDSYTVTVYGVGSTSGEYQLTMTSGFSQVADSDNFNGDLQWQKVNDPLTVSADNGQLALSLSGINLSGVAVNPKAKTATDYYAQVAVNVSGEGGWLVGMTARQQDADHYYLLQLNDE